MQTISVWCNSWSPAVPGIAACRARIWVWKVWEAIFVTACVSHICFALVAVRVAASVAAPRMADTITNLFIADMRSSVLESY